MGTFGTLLLGPSESCSWGSLGPTFATLLAQNSLFEVGTWNLGTSEPSETFTKPLLWQTPQQELLLVNKQIFQAFSSVQRERRKKAKSSKKKKMIDVTQDHVADQRTPEHSQNCTQKGPKQLIKKETGIQNPSNKGC